MQVFVENLYSILKFFLHFKPFYCETFWGHSWWVTWCWLWLHGTYLEELFCWKFMGGKPVISGSATRTTTPNENLFYKTGLRFSTRTTNRFSLKLPKKLRSSFKTYLRFSLRTDFIEHPTLCLRNMAAGVWVLQPTEQLNKPSPVRYIWLTQWPCKLIG